MDLPIRCLFAALDGFQEPLFIINAARENIFTNAAFRRFLDFENPHAFPNIAEIWPGIIDADLAAEFVPARFKMVGRESLPVRIYSVDLGEGFRLCVLSGNQYSTFGSSSYFHSQRLETLGMLAGGVAHDFNNVLAGILGHVTYLKTILPKSGPHVESLSAIEEGGSKASLLTQEILNFSKMDLTASPVAVDICSLTKKTFGLLRGALSPLFNLHLDLPPDNLMVQGVGGRLAQVVVNLVINARDAISADGNIWVRVRRAGLDDGVADCFGRNVNPAGFCLVQVEDDGCGIPEELLGRVLEPYFSTKKDKGTGLGLATVDAIVGDMGGRLRIRSKVGAGTQVTVLLPLPEGDQGAAGDVEHESEVELQRGSERILVVDDNDPVRNVLCVSLVHLGYSVEVAASGAEAITKFKTDQSGFDLVILDMLMPKLSGEEVFFELKRQDPGVRVLLISGHSSRDVVQNVLDNGGLGFVQKPFTIDQLSSRVRECLDAGKA